MIGFGAPTPPAGGSGSGGPAVDEMARNAAAVAQAAANDAQTAADNALGGEAIDSVARGQIAALPASILKSAIFFSRTSARAYTSPAANALLQAAGAIVGGKFTLQTSGSDIVSFTVAPGSGITWLKITISENLNSYATNFTSRVYVNGSQMSFRNYESSTYEHGLFVHLIPVVGGDVITVEYVCSGSGFTSTGTAVSGRAFAMVEGY